MISYRTIAEQLEKQYTLFRINRKYKDIHWTGRNEEYLDEQQKVAAEVDRLSKKAEDKIKEDLKDMWASAQLVAFDSRLLNLHDDILGAILVTGLEKQSDCLDLQAVLKKLTGWTFYVTRLEDLDEEAKARFKN